MLAAYGVDVLDPAVSLRRIHVLLQRLPPHARRGGEPWSIESELLAGVIDHLAGLTWVVLQGLGVKNAQKPQPLPRPRGTAPQPEPERQSWADAMQSLSRMPGVEVE